MATITATGQCLHCSSTSRLVVHDTAWCPMFPAVALVDWNHHYRPAPDDRTCLVTIPCYISRPVAIGDVVLMVSEDGSERMAAWGEVTAMRPTAQGVADGIVGISQISGIAANEAD